MSDVLILCYHAVSERWPANLSVTPRQLEVQLTSLVGRGFRGVTFAEAVTGPARHSKTLAVTFDDAYRSVLREAFPTMQRLGLPGTVFAPTDWIGHERAMAWPGVDQWIGSAHEQELVPMSWEELAQLCEAGWEVGAHTCSHPHLTQVDDAQLGAELGGSRAACEAHLGRSCLSIAYPYGDADQRVIDAAGAVGYRAAGMLASAVGPLPSELRDHGPLGRPRIGVYHSDSAARFRLKLWRPLRRVRGTRGWELGLKAAARA